MTARCCALSCEPSCPGWEISRDVSKVGFDNGDARFDFFSKMSAVCQDISMLGREALAALHEVIKSGNANTVPLRKSLRAWMEVHQSTGPPPETA